MNPTNWQTTIDETEKQLTRLYKEGNDAGFLIVSSGDVYVQFTAPKEGKLYGEAVSNAYLPKNKQLAANKIALLHEKDFVEGKISDNFGCEFSVATVADLRRLAEIAAWIFANVYDLPANAKFAFELELQG